MKEKEPQPSKLKDQVRDLFYSHLESSRLLVEDILRDLQNGEPDPGAIAAALHLIEDMSRTGREMVEGHKDYVIFSRDHTGQLADSVAKPEEVLSEGKEIKEGRNAPKTFGELLTRKLDEALPNKKDFTREELQGFTEGVYGSNKFFESQQGTNFERNEAIEILQKFLTTPDKKQKHTFTSEREKLIIPYTKISAKKLNKWSFQIGYDWKITPRVDFETTMQIKGLYRLEYLKFLLRD